MDEIVELRTLLGTALSRIAELETRVMKTEVHAELIEEDVEKCLDRLDEFDFETAETKIKKKKKSAEPKCGCDEWKTCFDCAIKV
jgi:hypothetical protein